MVAYDEETVQTAMCIWEAVLEHEYDNLEARKMQIGASAFRSEMMMLAAPFEKAWQAIGDEYTYPFDWEFIPDLLTLVDKEVDQNTPVHLTADKAIELARTIIK